MKPRPKIEKQPIGALEAMLRHYPLRLSQNFGHITGVPLGLRGYRDGIFDLVPGSPTFPSHHIVEVGTMQGWFAWRVLMHLPEARIWCIDPHEGSQGMYDRRCWLNNLAPFGIGDRAILVDKRSKDAADDWLRIGPPIDWIFIDGNHHAEEVYGDLVGWYPHVNPGGLISGHDIDGHWGRHVKRALHRFFTDTFGCEEPWYTTGRVYSFTGKKVTPCWWFYKPTKEGDQ